MKKISVDSHRTLFVFETEKALIDYAIDQLVVSEEIKCDVAASFQEAVFNDVLSKIKKVLKTEVYNAIYFGGGVTQNKALRNKLRDALSVELCWPEIALCLDNAAMIAGLGVHVYRNNGESATHPETRIPFSR